MQQNVSELRNAQPIDRFASPIERLRKAGCRVFLPDTQRGEDALSLRLPAANSDDASCAALVQSIADRVRSAAAISLTLLPPEEGFSSVESLERCCDALARAGLGARNDVTLLLADSAIPLHSFALITRHFFGSCKLFVETDATTLQERWLYLFRYRLSEWQISPVYSSIAHGTCPLLADESATSVLPTSGIVVPSGSTWLHLQIDFAALLRRKPDAIRDDLVAAIEAAVTTGDELHDIINWPSSMKFDARQHRRLAIELTGIADFVRLHGLSPGALGTLHKLANLLQQLRHHAIQVSSQLATSRDPMPALRDPGKRSWSAAWSGRWRQAARRGAMRNRNLLAMSPYALLPKSVKAYSDWSDLLPLLRFADVWRFADTPDFAGWKLCNFNQFHKRAAAVIRYKSSPDVVATRV